MCVCVCVCVVCTVPLACANSLTKIPINVGVAVGEAIRGLLVHLTLAHLTSVSGDITNRVYAQHPRDIKDLREKTAAESNKSHFTNNR